MSCRLPQVALAFVALFALFAFSHANDEVAPGTSDVVVLDDDNFDLLTGQGGDWLLEFYAPWYSLPSSMFVKIHFFLSFSFK